MGWPCLSALIVLGYVDDAQFLGSFCIPVLVLFLLLGFLLDELFKLSGLFRVLNVINY